MKTFYGDTSTDWSLTHLQLQKLVHLPFLAIVNLTFDDLLVQNFQAAGLDFVKINYVFRQSMDDKLDPKMSLSKEKPLILNLLGNMASPDNLVLTHNDLFDFLKTLFENKDEWLHELLHEADCFLFIGVPFEKWYMQLLLQKLSKYTKKSDEAERFALSEQKETRMQELFTHELGFHFVKEAHTEVIEELYKYCEDNDILNKPGMEVRAYIDRDLQNIYRFLLRGDIKSCINHFLTRVNTQEPPNKNLVGGLTMTSANFHTLERDKDILTFQESKIERNRIIKSLLYYLDQADVQSKI